MKMIQMRKKGSPHLVQIAPDAADNHFTVVSLIKISTGQIKGTHFILTADTAQWVSMYSADGFREVKEEVTQ
jgi:hypothetical protein